MFQEESQPEQRPNGRETQQPREQRVRELHLRVREEGQGEERDREVRWVEGESKREKQA